MSDLTQWTYKRSHSITSGTELTDYQVKIRVYRTEGTSTGDTVYLNERCKSDFSDIRFTDSNYNLLNYWIEEVNTEYAIIWIKLPTILPQNTIYIIYGNENAESLSDGESTFLFFDGFDNVLID